MKERSFDEMIAYFNRRVSEMDIAQDYKIELLGMVTALGCKHEKTAQPEIIRCRDCKHYYYADNRIPQEQRYVCDLDGDRWKPDSFCSFAERRTDETD